MIPRKQQSPSTASSSAMRATTQSMWPLLLSFLLSTSIYWSVTVNAFSPSATSPLSTSCSFFRHVHNNHARYIQRFPLFSILDDINKQFKDNENNNNDNPFQDFNPLDYSKTSRGRQSSLDYSGTLISLRKTTMNQLVTELLGAKQEDFEIILHKYQEFLLEPLDDDEAVLDPDSIYTPTMTRNERYAAYRRSMDQRVAAAKNKDTRAVLEAMRDFVLQFE